MIETGLFWAWSVLSDECQLSGMVGMRILVHCRNFLTLLVHLSIKSGVCFNWISNLWCCSRERFGEMHARVWWEENRARIHERYLWDPSKIEVDVLQFSSSVSKHRTALSLHLFILLCSQFNIWYQCNEDDVDAWLIIKQGTGFSPPSKIQPFV